MKLFIMSVIGGVLLAAILVVMTGCSYHPDKDKTLNRSTPIYFCNDNPRNCHDKPVDIITVYGDPEKNHWDKKIASQAMRKQTGLTK